METVDFMAVRKYTACVSFSHIFKGIFKNQNVEFKKSRKYTHVTMGSNGDFLVGTDYG